MHVACQHLSIQLDQYVSQYILALGPILGAYLTHTISEHTGMTLVPNARKIDEHRFKKHVCNVTLVSHG